MTAVTPIEGPLLSVDLLGPVRLRGIGGPIEPGPRMQRALVAMLAIHPGKAVSVDRLIDQLWADEPPPGATATLQAYISQLRRVLEPNRPPRAPATILVTVDPGYALMVAPSAIDLYVFEDLARRGRQALSVGDLAAARSAFAAATELWRGEALAEFSTEHWATGIAARLREGLAVVIEDQVDITLARGEHAEAVGHIEALVADQPLRERRWAQLLVALYRSGRQADALRAYQRCRAALAHDLGIDPGPDLQLLERAILDQDPSLDWAAPSPGPAGLPGKLAQHAAVDASWPGAVPSPLESADTSTEGDSGGRTAQQARLRERIDGLAGGGDGGTVILVGEPGIGKTTLAESAAAEAANVGCTTASVRCPDDGTAPTYWPWTQLLRQLQPNGHERVERALTHLAGTDASPEDQPAVQFALAQLVLAALQSAATSAPLVVVLDDLHAADRPSQAILATIAGDLHRLSILLIVTARDNEASAHFDQTLGDLTRHRGVERLFVPPLRRSEVDAVARLALHGTPSAELVDALHGRTGGNPFYLNELLRLLTSEHRALAIEVVATLDVPANVRDVLARRLARLPDGSRSLLTLASVIGREVDLDVLQIASSLDVEQLMFALDPAIAAGLLAQDTTTWGYRFRHGIVRESIYAAVSQPDRGRLHARVAHSLEQLAAGEPASRVAAIAHHLVQAGPFADGDQVVAYCRRAAEFARRQGAWTQAAQLLHDALTFQRSADQASAELRCELLIELGRDRRYAGDVDGAHVAWSQAIALAGELGADPLIARAAALFGQVTPWGSRLYGQFDPTVIAVLEAQLERLGDQDQDMRTRLLAALGSELYYTDRNADGERYAREAIVLARGLGDPELLGLALANSWQASNFRNRAVEARAATQETLGLVDRGLSKRTELATRIHHLGELACIGDLAFYDIELSRCRHLAVELRSPELDAHIGWAMVSRALFDGRWDHAEQLGAETYERMRHTSAPGVEWSRVAVQVAVARGRGRLSEITDQLSAMCDEPEFKMFRPAVVLGHLDAGRDDIAHQLVDQWWIEPIAQDWTWMLGTAYWATVSARLGAPDPQVLFDALTPYSGELAITGIALDSGGAIDALLADLARRLGRPADACRLARSALDLERRSGLRAWIQRTTRLVDELDHDAEAR